MIDLRQTRDSVVAPALKKIGLWSIDAVRLVIGTGLAETNYQYFSQLGGPALGFWQCEPDTATDIWVNYIQNHSVLHMLVLSLMANRSDTTDELTWNLQYAAAMCRIKYVRSADPIPSDLAGMADMWVNVYNAGGSATAQRFIDLANANNLMDL